MTLVLKSSTSDLKIEVERSQRAVDLLLSHGAMLKESDGSQATFTVADPIAVKRLLEKAKAL